MRRRLAAAMMLAMVLAAAAVIVKPDVVYAPYCDGIFGYFDPMCWFA